MRRRDFFKILPAAAAALPKAVEILATAASSVKQRGYNMWGISHTTYPRWKPMRVASESFDSDEVAAHFERIAFNATYGPPPDIVIVPDHIGAVLEELGCDLDRGLVTIHSGVLERVGPGDVLHAISDGEHHDDRGFRPTV